MVFDENFFVLVPTLLFIILAYKPAKKALIQFLDDRTAKVKAQLDDATRLHIDAQKALKIAQQNERDLNLQASKIMAQAKSELAMIEQEAKQNLEETLRRKEQAAFTRIAALEREALTEIHDLVADLTLRTVRNILTHHLPAEQSANLLTQSIQSLSQNLKQATLH